MPQQLAELSLPVRLEHSLVASCIEFRWLHASPQVTAVLAHRVKATHFQIVRLSRSVYMIKLAYRHCFTAAGEVQHNLF